MPKSAAAIEQQIREWKSSDIAPRRLLKHLPPPLGPSLRTYDSTESWNPQFHWPSTPVPDDSASQQAENTADLITSDDPWYLDAAVKLVIEKIHPRFSDRFPEYETVYAMLKNCSDTRLPLELFALGINLMKALARKEDWVREWMSSRPEPVEIHPYDDSMPHGKPFFSPPLRDSLGIHQLNLHQATTFLHLAAPIFRPTFAPPMKRLLRQRNCSSWPVWHAQMPISLRPDTRWVGIMSSAHLSIGPCLSLAEDSEPTRSEPRIR